MIPKDYVFLIDYFKKVISNSDFNFAQFSNDDKLIKLNKEDLLKELELFKEKWSILELMKDRMGIRAGLYKFSIDKVRISPSYESHADSIINKSFQKIKCIKHLRMIFNIGLKEAKFLSESIYYAVGYLTHDQYINLKSVMEECNVIEYTLNYISDECIETQLKGFR